MLHDLMTNILRYGLMKINILIAILSIFWFLYLVYDLTFVGMCNLTPVDVLKNNDQRIQYV